MNKQDELKSKIENIMQQNRPENARASKLDREIIFFERELLNTGIGFKFSQNIDEINPELAYEFFGNGKFQRSEYALAWDIWNNKTFRLVLTNNTHNNQKLLSECPQEFKRDTYPLLRTFVDNLVKKAAI